MFGKKKEKVNINFAAVDSVSLPSYIKTAQEYGEDRNNYTTYEYLYKNYAEVQAAIDMIAAYAVGGGYEVVGDDTAQEKVKEFFNKNKGISLFMNIVKTMLIYGDAYILISNGEKGELLLQILDPKKVYIGLDDYGNIIEYYYSPTQSFYLSRGKPSGDYYTLPVENVLHFSYNKIGNSPYGVSILKSIKSILDTKINLEKIAATMAWYMTHPLIHAKVGDEQNPPTLQDIMNVQGLLKKRVRSDGTIANNITTSYTVDIKTIEGKPDLQGIATIINMLKVQIEKALKVPKILMSEPEGSNRATSYNQLRGFIIFLDHIRRIVEDEVSDKLMPEIAPGARIKFKEVLREDEKLYADIATELYHEGIITVNEARAYMNLPPVEEG